MPEIREQAYDVARSVVRALHGETRRRPVDPYGLTLTTSRKAADGLQRGARPAAPPAGRRRGRASRRRSRSTPASPRRTPRWPCSATSGVPSARGARPSQAAHAAAAERHLDDREVSFLDAVTTRLRSDEATGAAALLRHIRLFPRDALAVSVAVPTVAFGGLTSGRQTADLVEGLGRTYGDDWWYAGQLAFVRQDQERWGEAEELASYALSVEPSSGHAVHARAHVYYETGAAHRGTRLARRAGSAPAGREANHRSHFSWHAALHELMQCDVDAVRRRYERELAPPLVTGSRALVDSGALLWRCHVTGTWEGALPSEAVCASAPDGWLLTPPTAFAALHSALGLAAEGDEVGLAALRTIALAHPTRRSATWSRRCAGRCSRSSRASSPRRPTGSTALLPRTGVLGGSAAQREVLEDTLVYALARSGQGERAAAVLDQRLSRRTSPLDARRRAALMPATVDGSGTAT